MASTYLCTDYNIKNSYPTAAKVVYMCSSLLQLAPGSRDLFQAQKRVRAGICVKYFLSFPQKKLSPEKTETN